MPSDASIYGLIRQPQPVALENPDDIALRRMRLDALMGQREMQGLQLQQARQGMADDAAWRDTLQRVDPTKPETFGDLLRANPKRALELRKGLTDIQGTESQTRERNVKADAEMAKMGRDMIAQANPQNYGAILEWGVKNNQKWALGAPPQFDPRWQAQMVMSADEWLKRNAPTIAEAETGRHNLATEANQAGTLGETRRHNRATEANAQATLDRGRWQNDLDLGVQVNMDTGQTRPITTAGAPIGPKTSEAQKKELATLDAQFNTVDAALDAVKKTPSAFSFSRGAATMAGPIAETVAGRMDKPAEREARSFVFNVVSKVINERAGAAQSVQELARLRAFLPAEADNSEQIADKLRSFREYLTEQRSAWAQRPGAKPPERKPPAPDPRKAVPASSPQRSSGGIKFLGFES